jgi:23S rRNA-/tRNA-specific pseudouridylate synthase
MIEKISLLQIEKLRIDVFLSNKLPEVSRSRLKECIQAGHVRINQREQTKPAHALKLGDEVSCRLPQARITTVVPQNLSIDIVYEDSSVVVVNKAAGASLEGSQHTLLAGLSAPVTVEKILAQTLQYGQGHMQHCRWSRSKVYQMPILASFACPS